MKSQIVRTFAVSATLASAMFAQNYQRQATMVGGGGPDRGKCTIEVVVDGIAQVEIRGSNATLRAVSGQPPQWRRFECSGAMPLNPPNFRFEGVDGRGRQQLLRDPGNGGVAVVQIEDKDGGREGYTFDIMWGGSWNNRMDGNQPGYGNPPNYGNQPNYQGRPNYRDTEYYRRHNRPFGVEEAVHVCQQAVQTQAARRFHTNNINFHRTAIDDRPGRQDWVTGVVEIQHGPREDRFGFACSVNFNNGEVRSATVDARPLPHDMRLH